MTTELTSAELRKRKNLTESAAFCEKPMSGMEITESKNDLRSIFPISIFFKIY
jgi:hypothetical protein